jgi:hypothetical protein
MLADEMNGIFKPTQYEIAVMTRLIPTKEIDGHDRGTT